jgi:hypothetical protein
MHHHAVANGAGTCQQLLCLRKLASAAAAAACNTAGVQHDEVLQGCLADTAASLTLKHYIYEAKSSYAKLQLHVLAQLKGERGSPVAQKVHPI